LDRCGAVSVFAPGGKRLNPFARTLIVALLTFASGLLGFFLQWLLPVQYVADAKGMIGSIVGLVTLLLALVLGLLVWTSYGVYTNQNSESQSLGPLILKLDFALEQYGPEADRGRDILRAAVVRARDRFWGGRAIGVTPYGQLRADLHDIMRFFASLEPTTDQQKQLSYGLLGTFNALSVAIEALGSIAVASAVYMILEFSQPYSGLFRISPVGVDNLIAMLGR
jgi:hypothetical protein